MDNRRTPMIIALVLGILVLVGMFFFIAPATTVTSTVVEPGAAPTTVTTTPVLPIIIFLIIALLGVVMGITTYMQRSRRDIVGKAKRDQDMFSVIDDLVQDLTPDEVDYLRGHLHATGAGQVEESMAALLNQRASDRRAGLRE